MTDTSYQNGDRALYRRDERRYGPYRVTTFQRGPDDYIAVVAGLGQYVGYPADRPDAARLRAWQAITAWEQQGEIGAAA